MVERSSAIGTASGSGASAVGASGTAASASSASAANRFGRLSELRLKAGARGDRTALAESFATMPFKVMHAMPISPFALPARAGLSLAAPAQAMVMAVSAGIMAGDRQQIDVSVDSGAALEVSSQAFEKIHRMDDGEFARRTTKLTVAPNAYLDYRPLPQIPFAGSSFASATTAELADGSSRLIYSEILSCGRAARGERFAYRDYANRVEIRVAGEPVFIDNTRYRPRSSGGFEDLEGIGFYEGFSHLANLVLVNLDISAERFSEIRAYLLEQTGSIGATAAERDERAEEDAVAGGITRLERGDCLVKLLGHRAQRLQEVLDEVRRLLA